MVQRRIRKQTEPQRRTEGRIQRLMEIVLKFGETSIGGKEHVEGREGQMDMGGEVEAEGLLSDGLAPLSAQ